MPDKPNFVLVPDPAPEAGAPASLLTRLRALVAPLTALLPGAPRQDLATTPIRPRLIFGFDATASREPAWDTAREVTDALFGALPGALDVALAVHGGSRLHTFTAFTANAA